MNQTVIENKPILETKMNDTSQILPGFIALAMSIFRLAPRTVQGVAYLLLCAGVAYLYIAPFFINMAEFFSNYYSFLGFLNPKTNDALSSLVTWTTVFFAVPIIMFLVKMFEHYLPNIFTGWLKRKADARNTEGN